MKKYVCEVCGWEYDEAVGDPENGIAPGTKFEELPEDFACPLCGVGKDQFEEQPRPGGLAAGMHSCRGGRNDDPGGVLAQGHGPESLRRMR